MILERGQIPRRGRLRRPTRDPAHAHPAQRAKQNPSFAAKCGFLFGSRQRDACRRDDETRADDDETGRRGNTGFALPSTSRLQNACGAAVRPSRKYRCHQSLLHAAHLAFRLLARRRGRANPAKSDKAPQSFQDLCPPLPRKNPRRALSYTQERRERRATNGRMRCNLADRRRRDNRFRALQVTHVIRLALLSFQKRGETERYQRARI